MLFVCWQVRWAGNSEAMSRESVLLSKQEALVEDEAENKLGLHQRRNSPTK